MPVPLHSVTHAHTFMPKHAPLILTLKPRSQAHGAESSSQSAGSLGEEVTRIWHHSQSAQLYILSDAWNK